VTNIYNSFTYKVAAEINWHRRGTKLRHCHPMYSGGWLQISNVFTREGTTIFEFVVVNNGSKLRAGAKFVIYDCILIIECHAVNCQLKSMQ